MTQPVGTRLEYWRAMYNDRPFEQITMLASGDDDADQAKMQAAYPNASSIEKWVSDALGEEVHADGKPMYKQHEMLSVIYADFGST